MSYEPVTDTETVVVDDAPVTFECSVCGDVLNSERGKKIHESRLHGIKGASNKSNNEHKESARKTKPGIGKKPLLSATTKLDSKSRELTIDIMAAGVAWLAIRYAMSSGVPVSKSEQDIFLVPEANRDIMFKPLTDIFETVTPAVRIVNTISERFEYIQCFMLWKQYRDEVIAIVESKKELGGVVPNGPTGQSDATNINQPTGKGPTVADFPNGFGSSAVA